MIDLTASCNNSKKFTLWGPDPFWNCAAELKFQLNKLFQTIKELGNS